TGGENLPRGDDVKRLAETWGTWMSPGPGTVASKNAEGVRFSPSPLRGKREPLRQPQREAALENLPRLGQKVRAVGLAAAIELLFVNLVVQPDDEQEPTQHRARCDGLDPAGLGKEEDAASIPVHIEGLGIDLVVQADDKDLGYEVGPKAHAERLELAR